MRMKLGLLVILAVAISVPNLSESSTIDRCHLKDLLEEAITLPKKLQHIRQKYLTLVICEVERKSKLNTELVVESGPHKTTTAKPITTTTTTTRRTAVPTTPPRNQLTTIKKTTKPTTTLRQRRRRQADDSGSPESKEETEEPEEPEPEELQESDTPENSDKYTEEPQGLETSEEDPDYYQECEDSDLYDEDIETVLDHFDRGQDEQAKDSFSGGTEDGTWTVSKYGLFQLTNGQHCGSKHRWSQNVCKTPCSNFINDNISDDIDCYVRSYHHWWHGTYSSCECRRHAKNQDYFTDCK